MTLFYSGDQCKIGMKAKKKARLLQLAAARRKKSASDASPRASFPRLFTESEQAIQSPASPSTVSTITQTHEIIIIEDVSDAVIDTDTSKIGASTSELSDEVNRGVTPPFNDVEITEETGTLTRLEEDPLTDESTAVEEATESRLNRSPSPPPWSECESDAERDEEENVTLNDISDAEDERSSSNVSIEGDVSLTSMETTSEQLRSISEALKFSKRAEKSLHPAAYKGGSRTTTWRHRKKAELHNKYCDFVL